MEAFMSVKNANINDRAADLYINRCKKILSSGLPDDWDGVETIDIKF